MATEQRTTPSGHENDVATPAPGDLELLRSFLSLHDHAADGADSVPASAPTVQRWLSEHELVTGESSPEALAGALITLEDLRTLVGETGGAPREPSAVTRLDAAAARAGISLRMADAELTPAAGGIDGAVGRLIAIAFLARLDGSFARLRPCSNPRCRSVFYDRSKNRSARWCDMRSCGNQAKVRAYRQRQRAAGA